MRHPTLGIRPQKGGTGERHVTDELEAQNADLRSEVAGKDEELRTLLNTKTFRYTAAVRRFYGRLRGKA